MDDWLIWLVLALVLVVAEVFTLTAALGILGGAALITAGAAVVGVPPVIQFVLFAVLSGAGLLVVRPIARRHVLRPPAQPFGVDALVGQTAVVLREVTRHDGRVRLAGEEWTARPFDESSVIPVGADVDVLRISGSTAFVYPRS